MSNVPKLPSELLNPIVTPVGFLSFPSLFAPSLGMNDQPPLKYRARILFQPGTDIMELWNRETAIIDFYVQAGVINAQAAAVIIRGLKDGAAKEGTEGYGPGVWFLSSSAGEDKRPDILDMHGQPVINANDAYGGCQVRLAVRSYINFKFPPLKICYALGAVLKVGDGKPFGAGKIDAQAAFGQYFQAGAPTPTAMGLPGQPPMPQAAPQQLQQQYPAAPQPPPMPQAAPQQFQQPAAPQQFQQPPMPQYPQAPQQQAAPPMPQYPQAPPAGVAIPGQPPAQPQYPQAPPPLPGTGGWPPQQ